MSNNHLAIAAVSAALVDRLQACVTEEIDGAKALIRRPDSKRQAEVPHGVDVFLYEVISNAFLSNNEDVPARRARETPDHVARPDVPLAALDLHYLLTFNGNDNTLEPHRLAGSVVSELASRPVLQRSEIERSIASRRFLKDPVLPRASEPVVITPLNLNLEEMSRLWSVLMHEPYSLSLQYAVTVVMFRAAEENTIAARVEERSIEAQASIAPAGWSQ